MSNFNNFNNFDNPNIQALSDLLEPIKDALNLVEIPVKTGTAMEVTTVSRTLANANRNLIILSNWCAKKILDPNSQPVKPTLNPPDTLTPEIADTSGTVLVVVNGSDNTKLDTYLIGDQVLESISNCRLVGWYTVPYRYLPPTKAPEAPELDTNLDDCDIPY